MASAARPPCTNAPCCRASPHFASAGTAVDCLSVLSRDRPPAPDCCCSGSGTSPACSWLARLGEDDFEVGNRAHVKNPRQNGEVASNFWLSLTFHIRSLSAPRIGAARYVDWAENFQYFQSIPPPQKCILGAFCSSFAGAVSEVGSFSI